MRCLLAEATSPLRQTGQRRSPIDGQLLTDQQATMTSMTTTAAAADRRRPTKGRSRHSDNRCLSADSVIAAAVSKVSRGYTIVRLDACRLHFSNIFEQTLFPDSKILSFVNYGFLTKN